MMKKDWTIKKLGELVTTINGLWKGKKPPFVNVAVIRNINFSKDCQLKLDDVEYLDVEEKQFKTRQLHMGDIIIEKSGGSEKQPVGRPILFNIQDDNYSFSNFTSTLRINNQKEICSTFLQQYLYHRWLEGDTKSLQSHTTGIHNLDFKGFLNFDIPVPPLEEQKRIVAVLDKKFAQIETLKTAAEKNLHNTKQLFQSELEKTLLTSQTNKVIDLFDIRTGKLNSNAAVPNGKYPFFTCSREIFSIDNYAFDCDAILLAGNNASGDFNVKHYCGKFNAYQRTYVLTVKESKTAEIKLLYYVLENYLKKLKTMSVGANTRFLKLGMIQNLDYPNYTLAEQKRIVVHLDSLSEKVHQLEEIYTKQLVDCEELKQSLLQKAFEGEL